MARRRLHSDDAILDAARDLLVLRGPDAATTGAISTASGAPVGSLYHRFGSRGRIFAEVWLRTVRRFQAGLPAAADPPGASGASGVPGSEGSGVERALAAADWTVEFAVQCPEDARLLLDGRREDLVGDTELPADVRRSLADLNRPVAELLEGLAGELFGEASPRAVEAVTVAVVDVPYAVVRRHLRAGASPGPHRALVAEAVRALLEAGAAAGAQRPPGDPSPADPSRPGKNLRAHRDT